MENFFEDIGVLSSIGNNIFIIQALENVVLHKRGIKLKTFVLFEIR